MSFEPDVKIVKDKYRMNLFPETWIIDKHGTILVRIHGRCEWGQDPTFVEFIDQLRGGGTARWT